MKCGQVTLRAALCIAEPANLNLVDLRFAHAFKSCSVVVPSPTPVQQRNPHQEVLA